MNRVFDSERIIITIVHVVRKRQFTAAFTRVGRVYTSAVNNKLKLLMDNGRARVASHRRLINNRSGQSALTRRGKIIRDRAGNETSPGKIKLPASRARSAKCSLQNIYPA